MTGSRALLNTTPSTALQPSCSSLCTLQGVQKTVITIQGQPNHHQRMPQIARHVNAAPDLEITHRKHGNGRKRHHRNGHRHARPKQETTRRREERSQKAPSKPHQRKTVYTRISCNATKKWNNKFGSDFNRIIICQLLFFFYSITFSFQANSILSTIYTPAHANTVYI